MISCLQRIQERGHLKSLFGLLNQGNCSFIPRDFQLARRCYQKKDQSQFPCVRLSVSREFPMVVQSFPTNSPQVSWGLSRCLRYKVGGGSIIGFIFIASPTVLLGSFCFEQKFSNGRMVLLQITFHCSSLGRIWSIFSVSQGAQRPCRQEIFWRSVLLVDSSPVQYLVTMGLRGIILQCWCVLLVLILEKEKNQAVTLRSRLVKNTISSSPLCKELTPQNDHLCPFSNDSKYKNRVDSTVLNRVIER